MKNYRILVGIIMITGIILIGKSAPVEDINKAGNFISNSIENIKNDDKKEKVTICIDPGHQQKGDSSLEPIAPGSSSKKARVSSGTAGVATKKAEYVLNLEASLILRDILVQKGYNVFMTRENHDVNISNAERAMLANEKKADMVIRIHADSLNDSSKTGASILIPSKASNYTSSIYDDSYKCAVLVNDKLKQQGIKVNGIFERNDLTGFNWSKVPVVLVEMGFMSNYNEDLMMSSPDYQKNMMQAIADGVEEYANSKQQGSNTKEQ